MESGLSSASLRSVEIVLRTATLGAYSASKVPEVGSRRNSYLSVGCILSPLASLIGHDAGGLDVSGRDGCTQTPSHSSRGSSLIPLQIRNDPLLQKGENEPAGNFLVHTVPTHADHIEKLDGNELATDNGPVNP